MSSLAPKQVEPRAQQVRCTDDNLVITLTDGRVLSVPLTWFPRLLAANADVRSRYELLGDGQGIHWPEADEDISVAGLLAGQASTELTKT